MKIAVDSNILVYAHRRESKFHSTALRLIEALIRAPQPWVILWPCVHEFVAVVTNPRIFKVPTPTDLAFDTVRSWSQGGNAMSLGEGDGYLEILRSLSITGKIQGPRVHDARIAALCLYHGVDQLWSADRDFSLFPKLQVRNPLLANE